MKEMCTIVHNKYRRITDIVMKLDYPLMVKFTVDLFKVKPSGNRDGSVERPNYYSEFEYELDGANKVTVIRNFAYFLEICPSRTDGNGSGSNRNSAAVITPEVFYYVKQKIGAMLKYWFVGAAANNTFGKRNGQYVLRNEVDPVKVITAYGSYMEFEPAVGLDRNNNQQLGVRVYINSDSNSYFLSIDSMFALYEFMNTFNMYMAAQCMLAYMGKPAYGTNHTDLNDPRGRGARQKSFLNR